MTIIRVAMVAASLALAVLIGGAAAMAQATGQQTTPPAQAEKDKTPAPVAGLTLDAAPPVNAEEDAAIKTFRDAPYADTAQIQKKLQLGDDFVKKYPESRYRVEVYGWQVKGFMSIGQVDKVQMAGEKSLQIEPNDPQTLAILGSSIPRAISSNTPNPAEQLTKAEGYCKKALELIPTFVKPENLSDELFAMAKNQTSALAYSGLGLVAFRRQKFAEAIPHLEQAVRIDPNPDPVNYFILGIANQKASHFDDAMAAFTKCAAIPGSLQNTCKTDIEEAKKLGATQLNDARR
jgi:tetratricopeptide (TPR) repeat protein